jgi:hypothetical protein
MDVSTVTTIFVAAVQVTGLVVWWPISKLIDATIVLLAPFYNIITFVLLPFIHLGGAIIGVLSIPFTVKWLERIEVTILLQHINERFERS